MELVTKIFISCGAIFLIVQQSNAGASVAKIGPSQIRGQTVISEGIQVSQYLGIPYAEPPIYDKRFKKPEPYSIYPTVFLAFDSPPACWQDSNYPFPSYESGNDKNEDCLYLNIWTPLDVSPQNKKAVIYWIHGGGLRFGAINQPLYFGAALSALGDVVVVTVNYRVGAFGFLTTGTDDAPGNIGLWDILEGLKWVNKNIDAFGGDKTNITIAGQGAGSKAVGLLSVSPLAKGLYQRQIMESGSPAFPDAYNNNINLAISQKIAMGLNCANETNTILNNATAILSCLRHTSPASISEVHASIEPHSDSTFLPQFGDDLLPTSARQSIADMNITCKEVLIGNVLDEGSYLITTAAPSTFGFFGENYPHIGRQTGEQIIRDIFRNFPEPEAVVKQYINSSLTDNDYKIILRKVYTSAGDAAILCPTVYYAEKFAANGGNVYYYMFRERPNYSPWAPWMGVTHTSEVEFVFGLPILHDRNFYKDEVQLSGVVIDIWSSFAKFGKPSLPWPLYSKAKPKLVYIGPGSGVSGNGTGPHRRNCNFFRPFYGF